MELFCHSIGIEGADRDLPKTVYNTVPIKVIEDYAPVIVRDEMVDVLNELFPSGLLNCWGVPKGADKVIMGLNIGDVMLLMRTYADDGEIPALGQIKAFWKELMPELSTALWGNAHFPYIFFFEPQKIDLTWTKLKSDVGYDPNYELRGIVSRIAKQDRLNDQFGGVEGYVSSLVDSEVQLSRIENEVIEDLDGLDSEEERFDGKKTSRYSNYYERNPKNRAKAIEIHGTKCMACEFDFGESYGPRGDGFIEVHHRVPVSQLVEEKKIDPRKDLVVLCSNCHRMIHRKKDNVLSLEELRTILRH